MIPLHNHFDTSHKPASLSTFPLPFPLFFFSLFISFQFFSCLVLSFFFFSFFSSSFLLFSFSSSIFVLIFLFLSFFLKKEDPSPFSLSPHDDDDDDDDGMRKGRRIKRKAQSAKRRDITNQDEDR